MPDCLLCNKPVEPHQRDEAWTEQTVLVHGPKKNGAALATDTGRVAHDACVVMAQVGYAPEQMSLFDE
jgi:hypothetical protein